MEDDSERLKQNSKTSHLRRLIQYLASRHHASHNTTSRVLPHSTLKLFNRADRNALVANNFCESGGIIQGSDGANAACGGHHMNSIPRRCHPPRSLPCWDDCRGGENAHPVRQIAVLHSISERIDGSHSLVMSMETPCASALNLSSTSWLLKFRPRRSLGNMIPK